VGSSSDTLSGMGEDQESFGVQMLRKIWDIPEKTGESESAPESVNTDIYNVPATARRVPHRGCSH